MHHDLGLADAVGVGMFLQTLLLALTKRGLGSCVEVSVTGYPEIIRAHLSIPPELSILAPLSVTPTRSFLPIGSTSPASR